LTRLVEKVMLITPLEEGELLTCYTMIHLRKAEEKEKDAKL